jgi:hypothetical protein
VKRFDFRCIFFNFHEVFKNIELENYSDFFDMSKYGIILGLLNTEKGEDCKKSTKRRRKLESNE